MAVLNIKDFPEELYHRLTERAQINKRSAPEEVIYPLERALIRTTKKKHSILGLRGLGKELWKNIEIARYINDERNWI